MEIAKTVAEVVDGCASASISPSTLPLRRTGRPSANTLYAVILACQPTVADTRRQLDYLAGLPDRTWEAGAPGGDVGRDPTQHCLEVDMRLIRLILIRYRQRRIRRRRERQRLLTGTR